MKIKTKRAVVFISIIAIALAVGVLIGIGWELYDSFVLPHRYDAYISKYATEYDIPQEIVYAIIKVESGFDPNAKSHAGAMGLMQMMPSTFEWLTGSTHLDENHMTLMLYDPEVSIKYGVYYLRYLKNKFDNWDTVFAAYNAGEGNVSQWLRDEKYSSDGVTLHTIPIEETENYVKKVNRELKVYSKITE